MWGLGVERDGKEGYIELAFVLINWSEWDEENENEELISRDYFNPIADLEI